MSTAFGYSCRIRVTSAKVDVYVAGMPVVVMLDETKLIMSPLRNQPGVHFVSTPEELARVLQAPVGGNGGYGGRR